MAGCAVSNSGFYKACCGNKTQASARSIGFLAVWVCIGSRSSSSTVRYRYAVISHAKHSREQSRHKMSAAISWPAVPCGSLGGWAGVLMFPCVIASKLIPVSGVEISMQNLKPVRCTVLRATHEPKALPSTVLSTVRTPY